MEDVITRFWDNMLDRLTGPLQFRLVLQPAMAIVFAIRDGLRDARAEKAPYFWSLFTEPSQRREHFRDGWKSISKVYLLAVVLDVIYQVMVLRFVYPGEALLVAFLLAFLPYLMLRGPVNRLARHWQRR